MNIKSNITSTVNKKDGIVLDENMMEKMYGGSAPTSKDDLADVTSLTQQILDMLEFMTEDHMLLLRTTAPGNYTHMIETKFPFFTSRYYGIYQLLLKGEQDISKLISMLETIENAKKSDKTMLDIDHDMKQSLKNKYVYPKMSQKEANRLKRYDQKEYKRDKVRNKK